MITPGAGYQIDPTNANSVVPVASPTPAAQAPATPSPVPATPAAPTATVAQATTVPPAPTVPSTGTPTSTATTPPATPAAPAQPGAQPLTYNPTTNPSVVDLLNSTGQDSSMAARQQLAAKYGIQGYTGTAAQNTDLATKYTAAYNALKGTAAPESAAAASTALDSHLTDNPATSNASPEQKMFDALGSMNPVVKNLYDQVAQTMSSQNTQQTLAQQYTQAESATNPAGIPGESITQEQMSLMNMNRVMAGTQDDIRNEISNAGGFATESQVASLTAARNKTLMTQASALQQSIQLKQDYVDHLMQFSQQDRSQVEQNVNNQLGLADKLQTLTTNMDNAAQSNYQKIVDQVGYSGLAQGLDANGKTLAEKALGLSSGALSNPQFLQAQKQSNSQPTASIQEYEYAKSQGYTGSFSQYQNEDANRKAVAAGTANGLSSAVIGRLQSIDKEMQSQPAVLAYQKIASASESIQNAGTSPADDLDRVYALMQSLNPGSNMVRPSSIDSVANDLKSTLQNYGLAASRVLDPTGMLTPEARLMISSVVANKLGVYQKQVANLSSGYATRIKNIAPNENPDTWLTNYQGGFTQTPTAGTSQIAIQDQKTNEIRYFPSGTDTSTLDPKLYKVIGKTK